MDYQYLRKVGKHSCHTQFIVIDNTIFISICNEGKANGNGSVFMTLNFYFKIYFNEWFKNDEQCIEKFLNSLKYPVDFNFLT